VEDLVRKSALLAAAASLAAAAALTVGGSPASASSYNYVALGDSYSSGVGTTSNYQDGSCDQSTAAYPELYANGVGVASFNFQACSGATAPSIESSQLGALNSSTTLVSLTDGGNDVGFSSIMETCVLESDSSCQSAIASAVNKAQTQLPGILDTLYTDIRNDAPNAHVVVIGYPEFYDLAVTDCVGLSQSDHVALDNAADVLDGVISNEVSKFGNFTFSDVRSGFSGHELCDSTEWLHSLAWPITDSYHPTAAGHSGAYLPAFERGI
jgi:lysophospholipase L1-like esterase